MPTPILLTKLFIPSHRPELVSRSHLVDQLNNGLHRKLTLISAPAGFGKTTVVTNWLHSQEGDDASPFMIGWLSLDEDDNDPTRFLTYLITALNRIPGLETEIGASALQMFQAPQPPPPQTILTAVINEIAMISNKIVLVIDDYHLIDSQAVHDALVFLLENFPPQLHLVITTREDPPLQISRLRTRGELNEFRAVHLRFSTAEIDEFLNQIMGLGLSTQDIAALEKRTEGWIAGVQLAAISMQGRTDISNFIQSFTGSHHFVIDYLVEEVLEHQPEHIRDFLLQTSILNRLTSSLCDAVTGQENGQATLEALEHSNLFIIRLDGERQWYRYHHLFSDSLHQRLKSNHEFNIRDLHIRARDWFSKHGMEREALQQSLLAKDFEEAAKLINRLAMEVVQKGEYRTVSDWINSLPDDIQQEHPFLWALHVWALRMEGRFEAAETRIADVEEALKNPTQAASADLITIKGLINSHKAYIAFIRGNLEETVAISRESLAQLPEDMVVIRTLTALYLGVALRYQGNLREALEIYLDTLPYGKELSGSSIAVFCFLHLSDLYFDLGELHKSKDIAEQALQFTIQHTGRPDLPFTGNAYICIGRVLRQWGHLAEALETTQRGVELCRQWNVADVLALACNEMADIYFSLGEKELAQDALRESLQIYQEFSPWASGLVAAHQAKHYLGFGVLEPAIEWLGETDLNANSPIDFSRDIEYLTLARVLIAQNKLDESLALLERIYEGSNEIGKKHTALEAIILQAKALFIGEDIENALERLELALTLGKQAGYVQIFVDEGPPMARLLYEALSSGIEKQYVQNLLAAFPEAQPEKVGASQQIIGDSEWIEPLSDRELEILQLIAEGFSRQEIASQLVLSLNTVKTHARNIFSKMGVNNQMQAVGKARGLGLLDID